MPRLLSSLLLCAGAAWAAPPLQPPIAQNPPAQDPASETSVAALQARLDSVAADTSLADDQKAAITEALNRALDNARITETRQQAIKRYAAQRATAPDRLAQRKLELQSLDQTKPGAPRHDVSLPELEQGYATAQQAQIDALKHVADLEAERARRAERRSAIPNQLAQWKTQLDALPAQLPGTANSEPRLQEARRLALLAERAHLQAEIEALNAEQTAYEAEAELMRTDADLAARKTTAAKADADAWLAVLQPMRAAEAERVQREAQRTKLRADPRLASLAEGNAELARALTKLAESREQAEAEKADRERGRQRLQQDFDEVKKRVVLVGSTDAVGALLRQRRAQLADVERKHRQRIRSRADRIADASLLQLEYDEQRRRLVEDPETWLQEALGGEANAAALPTDVLEEARRLRTARRDLLQQLTDGFSSLLVTETEVESAGKQLVDLLATYRAYVAERVLGIRSSPPIWRLDYGALAGGIAWFADGDEWGQTVGLLATSMTTELWPLVLAALLALVLAMSRLWSARLAKHGQRASRGTNVAYTPTALAAIDTVLLTVPIPALLLLCGSVLQALPDSTDFGKAIAAGMIALGWSLLMVLVLRTLVRPHGLAASHFQWQSTTVAQLRRAIPLLLLSAVPFPFALAALEVQTDDKWLGSLGGVLLIVMLGLLTFVYGRLLHPSTGIIGGGLRKATTFYRLRRLWYLLATGVPLALFVMTLLGYEYTVLQLVRRLNQTIAVIVAGVVVYALITRSLLLERRRLQIRRMQERALAAKAGDAAQGELPKPEEVDPQSLARQTQTLLQGAIAIVVLIAAYQIWVDVLPALGILRRVELYELDDKSIISLADLLMGLIVLTLSLVAARNLPGLLELFVLQRMRMQQGERHAVTTLARYAIVIAGLVWTFSSIGIGWSKVQWLVAAVSVGLGFGLQEIFANFVSGLILLFERPVRVGDLVQVGTTIGRVTRIRIRATTILDWDRKELVVPNRDFVTKEVVNWTLGDSVVRWTFPVGIAYGSDTEKALRLLEKVGRESRFVVADPPPQGVFVGFGDSTLNLKLWVHVDMNATEYRWMTELYQGIDNAFREAGIEIAFPQRDVNLKLSEQLAGLLQQRAMVE
jgi:potassium efflux system protein